MPTMESSAGEAFASDVSESDIARRAFELYCDRGCEHGQDVDDWLRAEDELRSESGSSAA
jgi:hypothetical protein